MTGLDRFIARSIKPLLVLFGLMTAAPLLFALNIGFFPLIFGAEIDYSAASIPALRHWGLMIGGLGLLLILAAFRPWLRFEIILFAAVEKAFIGFLCLAEAGQPWGVAYRGPALADFVILLYFLLYLASKQGRPYAPHRAEGAGMTVRSGPGR